MGVKGLNGDWPARLGEMAELFLGKGQSAFPGLRDTSDLSYMLDARKQRNEGDWGTGKGVGGEPLEGPRISLPLTPLPWQKALLPPGCVVLD